MVFQLNAQIPLAYRGYDYGRSQQNALRGMQMDAAEREIDEGNALARLYREQGAGLASDNAEERAAAARAFASAGPSGYRIAAPVLQRARDERAVAGIFGGGGAAAPAGAIPAAMPGAGGVRTGAAIAVPAELDDADILARTLLGEAANQGEVGQRAVAAVVRNRMRQTGRGVRDVVLAPAQFEPWGSRREELLRIPPTDPRYIAARRIAEQALAAGEFEDPTGGATHFLNPDLQRQLGRQQPSWAPEGQGRRIGAHVFYTPGGGVRVGQGGGAAPAGGDVVPASAQGGGGGGGPQRMPGQPTQAQFAQLMQQAATGNEVAQRLVQNWLPFMRQENPNFQLTEIDGQLVAIDPRNPNNRVVLGRAGATGDGITPARAQQMVTALAPRVASGQADEREVREYLAAVNVATNRVAENGTLVQQPLPSFAPPPDAVLRMYPNIAFQAPQAAPQAAPGSPMAPPQAAPQTPAAAGDAAPATVQLPPPPGPTMPGPGGGASRPAGPGSTVSNQIEERQFNVAEQVARLDGVRQGFRPEHQTFTGRWSNMWAALRERSGQQLSPQERQRLTEYTQSRARSLENLNLTIQAMTGAAMGVEEAQRIIATMPNPGSGLFDGDSPTEFQAKLDRATRDARNAAIRYSIARQRGLDPMRSGIRLEEVPAIVNRRGEEIAREIRADNPRLPENEVQQQTQLRLGAELGLR
jgi:hypothetical protein